MLSYNEYVIAVLKGEHKIGYIKFVDYNEMEFELVANADSAIKYATAASANKEISKISRFKSSINNNYIFEVR